MQNWYNERVGERTVVGFANVCEVDGIVSLIHTQECFFFETLSKLQGNKITIKSKLGWINV